MLLMCYFHVCDTSIESAYSKPPRSPFVIGDTKDVYAELLWEAGGFT